ncbi:MAG TPA: methylated-DNA--[protein]-cysteine S-methyltransferase [Bdellovibrionota bacterium]|jgi:methylated-DNA-[protein]-cysteine S-methyltransferase
MKKPAVNACHFPTAIGEMAVAWRAERVVGVFLPETSERKLLASVRKRLRASKLTWSLAPPTHVGHMAAQIRAHLRGESQDFDLSQLEMPKRGPFMSKVIKCLLNVTSGTVLTYAELAAKAGSPKAFRAVGQAMARNPFPIVIPCHRVVGASKNVGGFSAHGGLATKARILKIEAHDDQA